MVIGGRQHERSNDRNGSYDGEKEVVEKEVDGKDNTTVMTSGVSGRQKSAGKDGDRHNDGTREVIDGNGGNNTTTGIRRMVVASMPPPLVLSTLPPLLNAHRGSVASFPRAPLFPFASRSSAGCRVACCCVPPPCFTFCCAAASRVHP